MKNIVKSDPDITLASHEAIITIAKVFLTTPHQHTATHTCMHTSHGAVYWFLCSSQATELFVGLLSRESHVYTVRGKRKTVQRRDVDACIPNRDAFTFLEGTLDS